MALLAFQYWIKAENEHKNVITLLSLSIKYVIAGRINIVILSAILNDLTTGTENYSTTTHRIIATTFE